MSANTILTSVVTGGTNSHTTTAEEVNALRTDFGAAGVIGAITLNTGSGGTGSFCVNQNTGSNMAINILAGTAQFLITPSSQNPQMLRAYAAADYTAYTINANTSGSTKYDWIYLSGNATNANVPSATADNVVSVVTSRSSSNTTDNGTPPTYGLLLGYVTVANGATAITNANITDKRFNASLGAQNGSLIVNQNGTGTNAKIQAAGIDANVNLELDTKGSGTIVATTTSLSTMGGSWLTWTPTWTNFTLGNGVVAARYLQVGKRVTATLALTMGSTSSISGIFTFSLPVTANAIYTGTGSGQYMLGVAYIEKAGVAGYTGYIQTRSPTTANLIVVGTASTYGGNTSAQASIPFTWSTGDFYSSTFEYETV